MPDGPIPLNMLPPDLAEPCMRGQMASEVAGLIRRGIFEHDTPAAVQRLVAWMDSQAAFYRIVVQAHPQFATFWPEAARQLAAQQAAQEAPTIVWPDGSPAKSEAFN